VVVFTSTNTTSWTAAPEESATLTVTVAVGVCARPDDGHASAQPHAQAIAAMT
jgi:hypothetical protein